MLLKSLNSKIFTDCRKRPHWGGKQGLAFRFADNLSSSGAALATFVCLLAGTAFLASALPVSAGEPNVSVAIGPSVTVTKAKRACFTDLIDVTGTLVPKQEIFVQPEREGLRISQILVEGGDTVAAGQVLAQLALPEGQSGETTAVESPAPGLIGNVSAVVGTLTSFRAPPMFQIIANGEIELLVEVLPKLISRLSPGQLVKIKVVGVGVVSGHVRVISPTVDAATQLGAARISIGNDKRLRIGMFGHASVVAGQSCGVAIPLSALLYNEVGAIVDVVRDNRVEVRKVNIGLLSEDTVEIRDGLSEDDMIVSRAGAFLREGDRVRPVIAEKSVNKK